MMKEENRLRIAEIERYAAAAICGAPYCAAFDGWYSGGVSVFVRTFNAVFTTLWRTLINYKRLRPHKTALGDAAKPVPTAAV